jgi:hypothetical protein
MLAPNNPRLRGTSRTGGQLHLPHTLFSGFALSLRNNVSLCNCPDILSDAGGRRSLYVDRLTPESKLKRKPCASGKGNQMRASSCAKRAQKNMVLWDLKASRGAI